MISTMNNLPSLCALFALASSLTASAQSNPPPTMSTSSPVTTVVFGKGGDHDLHALIASPVGLPGPLPAVLYIHGGGWMAGGPSEGPVQEMAQHGYFAASIEYRLSNVAIWPAQIEDCKLAVRWLRANAAKYNVDPNRIGVWGGSAGGHLVACVGTMGDVKAYEGDGGYPGVSSAVQAVVDYYGPTNFIMPDSNPATIQQHVQLFGGPLSEKADLWKAGSPLFYVKAGDPPMLLVHGDSDGIVSLQHSILFDQALTKAGVPHELIVVKNADHGFVPVGGKTIDPSGDDIKKATYDFLDKYLKGA
jgi:acetyl esterase/lipase